MMDSAEVNFHFEKTWVLHLWESGREWNNERSRDASRDARREPNDVKTGTWKLGSCYWTKYLPHRPSMCGGL
jgi:hypothetical protein